MSAPVERWRAMHVEVRKWFSGSGNTYHSICVHYYDVTEYKTVYSGVQYGGDAMWLQTFAEMYEREFPHKAPIDSRFQALHDRGVTYSVNWVSRKRELWVSRKREL
jgi:hypothetical protein